MAFCSEAATRYQSVSSKSGSVRPYRTVKTLKVPELMQFPAHLQVRPPINDQCFLLIGYALGVAVQTGGQYADCDVQKHGKTCEDDQAGEHQVDFCTAIGE